MHTCSSYTRAVRSVCISNLFHGYPHKFDAVAVVAAISVEQKKVERKRKRKKQQQQPK